MLKNYFKIALRNIIRNKVYSIINILGLTLGITFSSLLFMLVYDEVSFDSMYDKKDRLYRVVEIDNTEKETRYYGRTAPPLGEVMQDELPEVEATVRIFQLFGNQFNFKDGDITYTEREHFYADSNFFNVFNFELIEGNPNTALAQPNSIVLDEEWAEILFGTTSGIVGNDIVLEDNSTAKVTGVYKKLPQNSHLQAKILISLPTNIERYQGFISNWNSFSAITYVLRATSATDLQLQSKVTGIIEKYMAVNDRAFYLQPMEEIHFNSGDIEYSHDVGSTEKAYVYVFSAVGIFMLLIACINYMNLATAKSLHRGKEIGIRKASGAHRSQLITQFFSESILISFISFAISIGLVDLLLPFFNALTGKQFDINIETFGGVASLMFGITLLVGLLSGIYPALLLSRLRPSRILKGEMATGKGSVLLRKVLVIAQFTLSIIMITATVIASRQLNFIQDMSLGYDNENLMVIDINSRFTRERFQAMKQEFNSSPHVKQVAVSSRVPGEWKNIAQVYVRDAAANDSLRVNFIGFDEDMLNVYGLTLKNGEYFSGNPKSDSLHVLINETAASVFGLEDPVGQYIDVSNGARGGDMQVIGVVQDFNFESVHQNIEPLIIGYRVNPYQRIDYYSLKFDPQYTEEVIAHAGEVYKKFDTSTEMEYHFLDQQWAAFYDNDRRAGNIFAIGAGITIFIACLGLFGLASFVIQKRTKEIGVRKVLGASTSNLFFLLSKSFTFQVLIAFAISVPVAWYFMSNWLDNFAYQFNLGFLEFIIAGGVALSIAIVSISYRVVQAASLNPAQTLKDE